MYDTAKTNEAAFRYSNFSVIFHYMYRLIVSMIIFRARKITRNGSICKIFPQKHSGRSAVTYKLLPVFTISTVLLFIIVVLFI